MKLLISKHLGFCNGVSNAYKLAIKAAQGGEPTYMLGYLVHNQIVINELKAKGVITISDVKEIPKGATGYLIISAHGLPPLTHEKALKTGLKIIDTTCPWVKKPQTLAKELTDQGYYVVVVGDKKHTEVIGIMGWAYGKALVIETAKDVKKIAFHDKIAVIAQTTQSRMNFDDCINALTEKTNELKVCDTICNATDEMQRAAQDVAKKAEIMLVIGDKKSANTRRLKELCEDTGAKTYQIESADHLDLNILKGFDIIGLTAGASTPAAVIDAVVAKIKGV
jgi:(E)-4-hydroxy-3-methyl-but-2-enyl pyrophosphate reductase